MDTLILNEGFTTLFLQGVGGGLSAGLIIFFASYGLTSLLRLLK